MSVAVTHLADPLLTQGERMSVPERIVVAPSAGVFRRPATDAPTEDGALVAPGQSVGVIEGPGVSTPVLSPFEGVLMGMIAEPGQRLRVGQPVAWLRVT